MLSVDKYTITLYYISELLRKSLKYEEDTKVSFTNELGERKEIILDNNTIEYFDTMFYEILRENNIDPDELFE